MSAVIWRVVSQDREVYTVGKEGVKSIMLEEGLGSTRIYQVSYGPDHYIEVANPARVEYRPRSLPLIPPGLA
jgi:hypothetical protein